MNPEKKRIYKVYTSIHTQFSMGHALPQRKEGQGWHVYTSSAITAKEAYVNQSLVFCCRAQRLVIWLLQWQTALSFASDDVACIYSAQKKFLLGIVLFCFFKYMYLQCGWTAVAYQLLHLKKKKWCLTLLWYVSSFSPGLEYWVEREERDFNMKPKWKQVLKRK